MKVAFQLWMALAIKGLADEQVVETVLTESQQQYYDGLRKLEATWNLTMEQKCDKFNYVHNAVPKQYLWPNGIVPVVFGQLSKE